MCRRSRRTVRRETCRVWRLPAREPPKTRQARFRGTPVAPYRLQTSTTPRIIGAFCRAPHQSELMGGEQGGWGLTSLAPPGADEARRGKRSGRKNQVQPRQRHADFFGHRKREGRVTPKFRRLCRRLHFTDPAPALAFPNRGRFIILYTTIYRKVRGACFLFA